MADGALRKSDIRRLKRLLQRYVNQKIRFTINNFGYPRRGGLEEVVEDAVRDVVYSQRFANWLRQVIGVNSNFGEVARPYLNQAVSLSTTGGTVSGTLVEVGIDYVRIRESATSEVLVPFRSAITISAL